MFAAQEISHDSTYTYASQKHYGMFKLSLTTGGLKHKLHQKIMTKLTIRVQKKVLMQAQDFAPDSLSIYLSQLWFQALLSCSKYGAKRLWKNMCYNMTIITIIGSLDHA
jgi:hypothetical protein